MTSSNHTILLVTSTGTGLAFPDKNGNINHDVPIYICPAHWFSESCIPFPTCAPSQLKVAVHVFHMISKLFHG